MEVDHSKEEVLKQYDMGIDLSNSEDKTICVRSLNCFIEEMKTLDRLIPLKELEEIYLKHSFKAFHQKKLCKMLDLSVRGYRNIIQRTNIEEEYYKANPEPYNPKQDIHDFANKVIWCKSCGKDRNGYHFKKEKISQIGGDLFGVCNTCCNQRVNHKAMLTRANNKPDDYMVCDSCDSVFHKKVHPMGDKLNIFCPHCESEEIFGFNEAR